MKKRVESGEKKKSLKVLLMGALGRAGSASLRIFCEDPEIEVVALVDMLFTEKEFVLPKGRGRVPCGTTLKEALSFCKPDVLVDFTKPDVTMSAVEIAAKRGIHMVIGTTGLSQEQLKEIDWMARSGGIGVLTGSLSFGVVLIAHLAAIAAKYFDQVEIIDLGKWEKFDAPSGAALDIAKAMKDARGKPFNLPPWKKNKSSLCGEEYEGITIHSLRLSDCYLHEEVIFGSQGGGTLVRIGLELTSAEYLRPGIIIAVKEAPKHRGLVYGLDNFFLNVKN
jgi:4-hydroxy-tetrahydrodipicolinate reductase